MVQSINGQPEFSAKVNSFHSGLGAKRGDVLVGDKGFEFFNEKNLLDYIQIPWEEIDFVTAQVLFGGKVIRSFYIMTKNNGAFYFTAKESGKILKAMRAHIPEERLLKAQKLSDKIKQFFAKKK